MKVNEELLSHVESLARLELSSEQRAGLVDDFKEVLELFSVLEEADVSSDTRKTLHPALDERVPLRADKPGVCLSQEDALGFTEDSEEGYFVGPRVNQ